MLFRKPTHGSESLRRLRAENRLRYEYHLSLLPRNHRDVLELLPLVFHLDASLLFPGLTGDVVYRIAGHSPSEEDMERLGNFFPTLRTLEPEKRRLWLLERRAGIEFLYLMGSAGTLGYVEGSDMDFWLGIERRRFKDEELAVLFEKIRLVESWLHTSHGMEVHFFVTDVQDLRDNEFGELGGESCGSALKKLLKDEFYRSMIYLAGRLPWVWAGLPAGSKEKPGKDMVDLGAASGFEDKEILGAVLWQILKGLHSPFKSMVKIGLLECYASEEGAELLCNRLRDKILAQDPCERVDPYLEMMELVRTSLARNAGLAASRRLMEQCFLIKCLSGLRLQEQKRKLREISAVAQGWNIPNEELMRLHDFENWSFAAKNELARSILQYFFDCYGRLRDKVMRTSGAISGKDLTVLGKTLRAYLQQEPGKIPNMFNLLDPAAFVMVRIQPGMDPSGNRDWELTVDFAGLRSAEKGVSMFRHPDQLMLLSWHVVNGFYRSGQKIAMPFSDLDAVRRVAEFLRQLTTFVSAEDILDQVLRNWDEKAHAHRFFLVPNWFEDNGQEALTGIHCITANTHGEYHLHYFAGPGALEECITKRVLHGTHLHALTKDSFIVFRIGASLSAKARLESSISSKLAVLVERLEAHHAAKDAKALEVTNRKSFWSIKSLWRGFD